MISLGNLLGLIFLLWLPILIGIYFFKSRPVRHKISSLYLWKKVHQKRTNQGFFEKFKNNQIFWLQLVFFFLLFFALSKPYFQDQNGHEKQIYIIDNTGSMIARSGLLDTRLNKSLKLVREHAKARKVNNVEVYQWNSRLQKINVGGNLEVKLSRIQPSHLPNSDFHYLRNQIEDFLKKEYKVSLFTDSLEYEQQLHLSNLDVEVFLSSQNNRNVFFESINGTLLNNGKLKFNVKVACTSLGGEGVLLVSQKGGLPQRIPFRLKDYDNDQFDFEVEPVSLSQPIKFELILEELDLILEDNLIQYFFDTRIPRIALIGFSESDLFLKTLKVMLSADRRFVLDNKQSQLRFVSVNKLPTKLEAFTIYLIKEKATPIDFQESRSHILESAHPLVKFIRGSQFSAAINLNANNSQWDSLVQIEQKVTRQSTPGLLIHKTLPSCIVINLQFNSYTISNMDYPILLENILRFMLDDFGKNLMFEVGYQGSYDKNLFRAVKLQNVNLNKPDEITLQGVYKSSEGVNYFARFPVVESQLKDIETSVINRPTRTFRKTNQGSNEIKKQDNSILFSLSILLAIIVMIYEWYLFSRRA